jgi:methyl-accepting chemotaxis protein
MEENLPNSSAKFISIKTKLLIVIIPVVILIVMSLVLISYSVTSTAIQKSSNQLLESSVDNQANEIESWLNGNLSALQTIKKVLEGLSLSQLSVQTMLNQFYNYNSNFPDGVYLTYANGTVLKATSSKKNITNPLNSIWYKGGLTRINMGFGNAYTDEDGNRIISASGIVTDNSNELKVLSADLSLEHISIIVNSYIEMNGAQSLLVNTTDGTILASRDSSLISTKLYDDASNQFLNAVAKKFKTRDFNTNKICDNMTTFKRIEGTDWMLVSYIPTKTVMADVTRLGYTMLIICVISVLLLILLINYAVHVVIKPVHYLTKTIKAMTSGDFTIDINTRGNDEISQMSHSIKNFIGVMRGMISDISGISNQLRTQANGSNHISQEMYIVSKLQADSMKELNGTVDQLAASVNEVADSANTLALVVSDTREDSVSANDKMTETVKLSEKGRSNMEKVSSEMLLISESIRKLETAINRVGSASAEINKIVNLIGEIAEQSNLLSLNASIEAARAGEAGKGFSVVAAEIRKLAQTSTDSVKDITVLVHEIRGLINDAVNQSNESASSIVESSALINTAISSIITIFKNITVTNDLMKKMVGKIGKVDEVAASVASISEEQAASSEEILSTSENMVMQASNISKNSKKVATDSDQLSNTSEKLAQQVKKFKI